MDDKISFECSKKEIQLLLFMRNEFRFGKLVLVVHAGNPQKVIVKEPEKIFDGNIKIK